MHVNRCCVVCSSILHDGQSGEVCVRGLILCKYVYSRGDFPVRSCARVRLLDLGNDSSFLFMLGAIWFIILFSCLFSR